MKNKQTKMSKLLFQNLPRCLGSTFLSTRLTSTMAKVQDLNDARPISEMPGPLCFPILGSVPSILLAAAPSISSALPNDVHFCRQPQEQKVLLDSVLGKVKQPHLIWEMMVKKYGPISKFKFMGMPEAVILTLPDDIEKVYRSTMENPIRNAFTSLKKVRYEEENNYFEHKGGILVENNDEWWRVRSRVQAPMLRPKSISKYISQMDEVTLDFMERIAVLQNTLGEMPANFLQELYKWSLESVSLVALNKRLGCLRSDLSNNSHQIQLINTVNGIFEHLNATEMQVQLWRLFPTPSFKRLEEAHSKFLRIANAHIKEAELQLMGKKGSYEGGADAIPFLQRLLQEEHLSRKDVLTIILDMLFAGIDTTSHTLGFTLYLLAKNPRAQKRLQQEVDSVLGDGKGAITESQLARLSFLKACVKESLRIFPLAIGNARVLTQDLVLSGYRVPKGFQAFALNIVTSHDESLFPRAKEFLPERWGRDQPFGPIHPYASLPFSHGPRMCIGRRVAEQEMYIFLARVFQRFNIDYKYKEMTIVTRLVSLPSEPLKFQFTEREKLTNQIGSRNC